MNEDVTRGLSQECSQGLSGGISRRGAMGRLAAVGAALGLPALGIAEGSAMDRIRRRGTLVVGLYNDMPPFHVNGRGIDVELAQALAEALGLALTMLPFAADEHMNDDLRNMVWRGHYLGYGPADVLMHVPVDKPLMDGNPRVTIFGPYFRESVAIARDGARVPSLESMRALSGHRIAVPGQSLAGWLLIGAEGGAYREHLVTKLRDGTEAAQLLRRGAVAAAAGLRSELESVMHGDPRFPVDLLPLQRAPREGWAVGMAVKKESSDLARALQQALHDAKTSGRVKEMFASAGVTWRKP